MNEPVKLSPEKQFTLIATRQQMEQMSRDQLLEFAILLHEQLVTQHALYSELIKKEWGLGDE
jgi:hypothetical protein